MNNLTTEFDFIDSDASLEETKPTLTNDQFRFIESFIEWFSNASTSHLMTLSGAAGCGKTFVSTDAIKYALNNGAKRIGVCAPTKTAVAVLTEKLQDAGLNVSKNVWDLQKRSEDCKAGNGIFVGTLHQFISARPELGDDPEAENLDFIPQHVLENQPIASVDLLIVDEASMITSSFFKHLKEASELLQLKILFMGDQFQLFPIEKNPQISKAFSDVPLLVEMNTIVRYSGDILKEATQIRELMEFGVNVKAYSFKSYNQPDFVTYRNHHTFLDGAWMEAIIAKVKEQKEKRLPLNFFRVVTFRRKTMEQLNQKIREILYGDAAIDSYFTGENFFTHGQCSNFIPMETRLETSVNRYRHGTKSNLVLARLANSRDYNAIQARQIETQLPDPSVYTTCSFDFPHLVQAVNLVTFKVFDYNAQDWLEYEYAILSPSQLAQHSYNAEQIEAALLPVLDTLDHKIAHSSHKSLGYSDAVTDRAILADYLRMFNYCYNVDTEVVYNSSSGSTDEAVRTTKENGKIVKRKSLCKLQPGYAITTHKAQGNTYNHVFVLYQDFFASRELDTMYRLIYTALTRASESVHMFTKY